MKTSLIRSVLAALSAAVLSLPSAFAQSTTRVSLTSSGGQSTGGGAIPSISADGRYVAFISSATDLVPGDTNGRQDVFVRDRQTGQTNRVSVSSTGAEANDTSSYPVISGDGRYVAFESSATNLVPGDANGYVDIFVFDRQTGAISLASVNSAGLQANESCDKATISADGRYVAFGSSATNLAPNNSNSYPDIFVRDLLLGVTSCASVNLSGWDGNGRSLRASISADGRLVAFWSDAWDLLSSDTNGGEDCFVRDLQANQTIRVSVISAGVQADSGSHDPSISADGRYVSYTSNSTNLVPGDTNGKADIFIYDLQAGQTSRASVSTNLAQSNHDSETSVLSADGRYVAFVSLATNLVTGDTNGYSDIFVRDRQTGETVRVSVDSSGSQANNESQRPSIVANGREIAFDTGASNLVPGDTNNAGDAFVNDRGPVIFSLAKSGACPGAITLTVTNSTPNRNVAFVYGPSGNFVKPTPPCQGLILEIAHPKLGAYVTANAAGTAVLNFYAPPGVCGLTVQAVDVPNCSATNTIIL